VGEYHELSMALSILYTQCGTPNTRVAKIVILLF